MAVVPKLRLATLLLKQPVPKVSQPLSEPDAITGVPSAIPVKLLASFVTLPITVPESIKSYNLLLSLLKTLHLK